MVNWFTNGAGDRGSITGQMIPKTQKMVLGACFLTFNIIRYGSRVSGEIQEKESR